MIVNSNNLMADAFKNGYAIPQYNVNNLEWAKYILEACQKDRSPVILGFSQKVIRHIGGYNVAVSIIRSIVQDLNITVPVVIHLDHANSFEACKSAIDAGFTSVMIDASSLPLEQNIDITTKVVDYAKLHNVSVEAELGNLGSDDIDDSNINVSVDIGDCKEFIFSTNIDSLAPSVGNSHGFYKEQPKINFELLGAVCKEVKTPLVFHGGSFLDENRIKTAIFCGVCKININTELQYAWSDSVRKYLSENLDVYDPKIIISSGENSIKKVIHEKNNLFGSKNKG